VSEHGNTDGEEATPGTDVEAITGFLSQERVILLVLASVQFTSIVDFMVVMPLAPQLVLLSPLKPQLILETGHDFT
jgi:hypothetical protein